MNSFKIGDVVEWHYDSSYVMGRILKVESIQLLVKVIKCSNNNGFRVRPIDYFLIENCTRMRINCPEYMKERENLK